MIELLVLWEDGWLPPDTEAFMWRQLRHAYDVDRIIAVPQSLSPTLSVDQYDSMEAALAAVESTRVYLQPSATVEGINLLDYTHPEQACYIFGRSAENNLRFMREEDHVVTIYTPNPVDIFAVNAAAIVLQDRWNKSHVS